MNLGAEEGEEGGNENILTSIFLWTVGEAAVVGVSGWVTHSTGGYEDRYIE